MPALTKKCAIAASLIAMTMALAACANTLADQWLGAVDTTPKRIYRAAGAYGVIAGLACEYVQTPTALPGASARLAQAGAAAYDAVVNARAYAAFDDDAIAGLASLSGLLTGLAAQTLEVSVDAPDMDVGGLTGYAVERALQVAVGYAHLRTTLAGLKADLAAMVAEGRDPTETQWTDVMEAAQTARDCLTAAGEAS